MISTKNRFQEWVSNRQELFLEEFINSLKLITINEFLETKLQSQMDAAFVDGEALSQYPLNDEILARLNTYLAIVIIIPHPFDKQGQAWLDKLLVHCDRVIGIHHLPFSQLDLNLMNNQVRFFHRQAVEKVELKKNMIKFSQEIDELIKSTQSEMIKAKRIHEELVPKRMEDVKGLNIFTKYMAGDGGGTEYFDMIKTPQALFVFGLHTDSYLTSSCVMNILNKQRQLSHADAFNFKLFFQQIWMEVDSINQSKKKPVNVKIILFKIDHAQHQVYGYNFGDFDLLLTDQKRLDISGAKQFDSQWEKNQAFQFKLNRGDKLVVFSPGFRFNWKEGKDLGSIQEALKKYHHLGAIDLVIELFLMLRSYDQREYLSQDTSVVLIEVNKNAIVQV